MVVSVTLVALSTVVLSSIGGEGPAWHSDYATARKIGAAERRPLVVVVGSGEAGWKKMSKEGNLGKDVNRHLADHFVCLYLDRRSEEAKTLAEALDLTQDKGLVITDGSGKVQAFRHQGDLANADLLGYLQKYADPDRVVRATEGNAERRVSNYYDPATGSAPYSGGMSSFLGGSGGRSC